jgi:hypothetical protein
MRVVRPRKTFDVLAPEKRRRDANGRVSIVQPDPPRGHQSQQQKPTKKIEPTIIEKFDSDMKK